MDPRQMDGDADQDTFIGMKEPAVGRVTGPGMSRTGNGFTQSLPRRSLTTLSVP